MAPMYVAALATGAAALVAPRAQHLRPRTLLGMSKVGVYYGTQGQATEAAADDWPARLLRDGYVAEPFDAANRSAVFGSLSALFRRDFSRAADGESATAPRRARPGRPREISA